MILVDERVGSGELAPAISKPTVLCRMDYGDFAWSGNGPEGQVSIGVERKKVLDLLDSMTSGRLSGHQLIGLTDEYDWIYLLVEGIWQPDKRSGLIMRSVGRGKWVPASQGSRRFMARDLYNFVNSMVVMCGVIPVYTNTQFQTVSWLESCYGWWQKKWDSHKSHLQFNKPITYAHLKKPNLVTRMASQVEGIGWDKARKIGNWFGTIHEFVYASESELCQIEGIGKKLASNIRKQLGVGS